ncbi:MAG TPA: glycosyltransferase [Gemmatimonadales bacterium]|nr:glycosyltransferase [Gemmatimonadales bacterium]
MNGARVILVAAFDRRYHRSGYALATALASLGCEVRCCEERERGWRAWLGQPSSLADRLAAELKREHTDLVLVFKGARLSPVAIAALRRGTKARWANWFPDDPHDFETSVRIAPAYDCFFTHDSSCLDRHRAAGARAHYLAFGCDPDFLRPLEIPRAPLVFVGTRDPLREQLLREITDLGLVARGPGWPGGPVYGDAFVRALAGAKVGVNVHQQFGTGDVERYGSGANMRVFELAAIGTPQLSDAKGDIPRHFTPDREIVLYRTAAELRERAKALLDDEALCRSLATAARGRALREHTWAQRLRELLSAALP